MMPTMFSMMPIQPGLTLMALMTVMMLLLMMTTRVMMHDATWCHMMPDDTTWLCTVCVWYYIKTSRVSKSYVPPLEPRFCISHLHIRDVSRTARQKTWPCFPSSLSFMVCCWSMALCRCSRWEAWGEIHDVVRQGKAKTNPHSSKFVIWGVLNHIPTTAFLVPCTASIMIFFVYCVFGGMCLRV